MFELGGVHEDGRDGQSVLVVAAGRGAVERRNGDERRLASPTSIPAARGVLSRATATPQDTPHCLADTRGIRRTVQLPTGSGPGVQAAPRQPLAVSVQDWKEDDLTDEVGPPWACAAQPASNLQNQ